MALTADTLNLFLRAAGSEQTFSYGSSKYYDGQTFGDLLYQEWPAQTIMLSLEKRLLERIATAHRAISKAVNKLTHGSLGLDCHGSESYMIFFPQLRVKIKKSVIVL